MYSKCGNHLLLGSDEIFVRYYLVEEFKIRGLPQCYESDVCVESLVRLDGGGGRLQKC